MGRILLSRVLTGQALLPGMLAAKNAGNGLAALIPANMRAMAVRVDDVVGVAGFIHPDDRVDVLVTLQPNRAGAQTTTKIFMQNVKVLAVGQEVEANDQARMHASPATVATLLVSPQDSERLALASAQGRLLLTLRSWTDSLPVNTEGAVPDELIGEPMVAAAKPAEGAARPPAVAARRGRGKQVAAAAPPRCCRRSSRRRTSSRFYAVIDSSSGTSRKEKAASEDEPRPSRSVVVLAGDGRGWRSRRE